MGTAWGQWQPLQPGGLESRASRLLPSLPEALPSFPAAPHLLCHPPGDAESTTVVPCSLLYWHKPLRQAPSTPAWSTVPVTAPVRGIWRLTAPAARMAPTRRLHRLIPCSLCGASLVPGLLHPLPERLTFVNLPSAPRRSSLVKQNRQDHAEALPHFSFFITAVSGAPGRRLRATAAMEKSHGIFTLRFIWSRLANASSPSVVTASPTVAAASCLSSPSPAAPFGDWDPGLGQSPADPWPLPFFPLHPLCGSIQGAPGPPKPSRGRWQCSEGRGDVLAGLCKSSLAPLLLGVAAMRESKRQEA